MSQTAEKFRGILQKSRNSTVLHVLDKIKSPKLKNIYEILNKFKYNQTNLNKLLVYLCISNLSNVISF